MALVIVDNECTGMCHLQPNTVSEQQHDHEGQQIDHDNEFCTEQLCKLFAHIGSDDRESHVSPL